MNRPVQAGDLCTIVDGVLGPQGPNIGKQVRVRYMRGEHSKYGMIWLVCGEALITEYGAIGDSIDCAQSWLRRIDEPPTINKGTQHQELSDLLT